METGEIWMAGNGCQYLVVGCDGIEVDVLPATGMPITTWDVACCQEDWFLGRMW